jgi:hypothetical protein
MKNIEIKYPSYNPYDSQNSNFKNSFFIAKMELNSLNGQNKKNKENDHYYLSSYVNNIIVIFFEIF